MSAQSTFAESIATPDRAGRGQAWFLWAVDAGLAGCIFGVPMLMGGRQALGELILAALAVGIALAWTLHLGLSSERVWRWSGAEILLLAGGILLLVQLAFLPQPWLGRLAPHTAAVLPLWNPDGDRTIQLGAWSQISLAPASTREGLVVYLSYVLLFLVALQRIRLVADVQRLVRWCAASTVAMAAFGIVQYTTANGKFFWFYEHPFTNTFDGVKGPFTNPNHFAHFLALGTAPLVWRLVDRGRRPSGARDWKSGFGALALGVVVLAGLLSFSRGGMLAILLAAAIATAVCYRASSLKLAHLLAFGAAALIIGVALTIVGHQRVSERIGDLASASVDSLDRNANRRAIWSAAVQAIPDSPLLGTGVGSFREVYPMYLSEGKPRSYYYSHAENGPLQLALETGLVGLALVLAGSGLCCAWCIVGIRRGLSPRNSILAGAIAGSLAASVLHSLVDFVWYVPGCMAMTIILAACACRLRQFARPERDAAIHARPLPAIAVAILTLGVFCVGTWMLSNRLGPVLAEGAWHRYLVIERALAPKDAPALDRARESASLEEMVLSLETALRWEPNHARAHLALAETCLRRFHLAQQTSANAMPLGQISDAAMQAGFRGRGELEQWLARSIGPHAHDLTRALAHVRQALALCPLLGEGYLYLGELCFLEGRDRAAKTACTRQALQVRPLDGTVSFHAGLEAWMAGDVRQWLACWQQAFRSDRRCQQQIFACLAGRAPAADRDREIRFLLDAFPPDVQSLRLMYQQYHKVVSFEEMVLVRNRYCRAVAALADRATEEEATNLWLELQGECAEAGQPAQALEYARKAFRIAPHSFPVRYALAQCLLAQGQFHEAEQHLEWCLQRKPTDRSLQDRLSEAVKRRLSGDGPKRYAKQEGGLLQ